MRPAPSTLPLSAPGAALALLAWASAGCSAPVVLSGTIDRPAIRDLWFSFDDRRLLIRTDAGFVLADMALLSAAEIGPAGGPDTTVWVSPVSDHFVEVDLPGKRARMLHGPTATPLSGLAGWGHRGLEDWFEKDMPPPHRPEATWSDWFTLGDAPPAAPAPPASEPEIPKAGDVLPADPAAFWIRFAAGRLIRDVEPTRTPTEAEVREALAAYDKSRAGFKLLNWSQAGRPAAPDELDSPQKRWRVHLRPNWNGNRYGVDVVREDMRTGKKLHLIRSGSG